MLQLGLTVLTAVAHYYYLQSQPLAQLLQQCARPDAAADFQLNVVAALGQLARDQQAAAEAMMAPQGKDTQQQSSQGRVATAVNGESTSSTGRAGCQQRHPSFACKDVGGFCFQATHHPAASY